MSIEIKRKITDSLLSFQQNNLYDSSLQLFNTLGYDTNRSMPLKNPTWKGFKEDFVSTHLKFDEKRALVSDWKQVQLLFQLSKGEIEKQVSVFDTKQVITQGDNQTIIESYLFFAIELADKPYSRTELSLITRELNRLFPMPVMIIFRHGATLTISIINRRLHKKDDSKDVLEKVTLIKDISIESPHRAHIEILFDLSFTELKETYKFSNFVELHAAWQKKIDTRELNKRFFQELANWYFWAIAEVIFPDDEIKDKEIRNAVNVIRLITRLIFVWFLREKHLVPGDLFDEKKLKQLLNYSDKNKSTFYKAILQNLFFATLNTGMGNRRFRTKNDPPAAIHNLFCYEREFIKPAEVLDKYFAPIPFLNGGLFECLDKEAGTGTKAKRVSIDAFSDSKDNVLKVSDELFFCEKEKEIDLNEIYGTKNKRYKVRGLIDILNSYKFTITENTPVEEEVALDPELLGKVFENLLANYNPETQTTARKLTGSFYTPREIVSYMVDESLQAYLCQQLQADKTTGERIETLLSYAGKQASFSPGDTKKLVVAIDSIKILDPACGSGAFPMGILQKLVHILHKLDPQNELWKQRQLEKAAGIEDAIARKATIKAIEEAFENNEMDYGRKLYLIENCIYGVDIQPIAVQIAKLRFFISLIVEQKANAKKENFGVRPLPNLETKFVAANTLVELEKEPSNLFTNADIEKKKGKLKKMRSEYFEARSPSEKEKCRGNDKKLREELAGLLVTNHDLQPAVAKKIVAWDPYNQNTSASFFDMEWMFGLKEGFDIVIANPPYKVIAANDELIAYYKQHYKCASGGKINLYKLFFEKGLSLLIKKGTLSYITPYNYLTSGDSIKLREILLKETAIKEIIDYEESEKIFESVTQAVATIVASLERSPGYSFHYTKLGTSYELDSRKILNEEGFLIKGNNRNIESIKKHKLTFNDIVHGFQGEINVSTKKEFFSPSRKAGHLPLVRGNQIGLYQIISKVGEYCPVDISARDHHKQRRIVFQEVSNAGLAKRVKGTILQDVLCGHTTNYIIPKNENHPIEALLAILNSSVVNFYFKFYNQTNHVPIGELKKIPIPDSFPLYVNLLKAIVEYILFLKKQDGDTIFFERVIDAIVYELYFPEEVESAGTSIIKQLNNLPALKAGTNELYKELNDRKSPISIALAKLTNVKEMTLM